MALDASEIVVAGTGAVYRAPVGTTPPSTIDTAPGVAWAELGYVTEDGAKVTLERSTEPIMAWQSYYPLRHITTEVPTSVEVALLQWNPDTVRTALGGGTFDEAGSGTRYTPPDEAFVDEFAFILEGQDGPYTYRFTFPRVMVSDTVELAFVRSEPVTLPLKLAVLAAPDGGPSWTFDTDAPFITADASS